MADEKASGIVPPKYDVNAKWDTCIDLTVRRFAYSSLAGAFTDSLEAPGCTRIHGDKGSGQQIISVKAEHLRSPVSRWASVAFGAGVGIGSAYTDCSRIFDGPPAKVACPKVSDAPAPQDGQE
ncbi:hypothetical protein JRO89_XS07G0263200 [Xanthoceras sorbifolium]|uniref:MICOS complex subunit MIC10 n=1 Tax=Xanthoceras sorbifolium TaxID=99658 RepID=A0ABQ8HVC4_9ROSI|nr:hypothetical protein JRO89_XS07G0263200 [Xanthoceras sorbifolium]